VEVADQFKPEVEELAVSTVDSAIKELAELRAKYEAEKKIYSESYKLYQEKVAVVLEMLEKMGKKGFKTDGVASVTKKTSLSVRVPSSHDDKAELFKWLKDNLGAEGFLTYATVNSASINALYNSMYETAEDKENFKISGIGEPVERVTLSFRKA
jgi:hypothetical protein